MRVALMLVLGMMGSSTAIAQTANEFQHDFETVIEQISEDYAYFDLRATRWDDVPELYAADLRAVKSRDQFVALLERVLDELYDPHMQLNVNLKSSPRLVPSGTDLWTEWQQGQATITQVRGNSDAQRAGLTPGTIVNAINGIPIADAVEARLGRAFAHSVPAARDWALRAVLAGQHNAPRVLQIHQGGIPRKVELPAADQFTNRGAPVTASEIRAGIGYILLNDSLGNSDTVEAFDRALEQLRGTRGLIIDLRNTASGGNSSVARGILGRFIEQEQGYQKHVLPSEERDTGIRRSWNELVTPRGEFAYTRPVAVLVNRWTGSMGEGLAIGFDATKAGTVVGTGMAGLVGATSGIRLAHTGIGINVPTERLYHVNGTPREDFRPPVLVDPALSEAGADPFLEAAFRILK